MISFIPKAYAQCNPGEPGLDLKECFFANAESGATVDSLFGTPSALVNTITSFMFVLAGIILMILIMYSGWKFVSQGTKGKDEAKTIMTVAVTGLVVMFAAYWVVQIIGLMTGMELLF